VLFNAAYYSNAITLHGTVLMQADRLFTYRDVWAVLSFFAHVDKFFVTVMNLYYCSNG
jgi:hypothetical protein